MKNKPDDAIFPMLDGPPINWGIARLIYKVYGCSQTLESIAKRGGFGWGEVELMCDQYKKHNGNAAYNNLWRRD